MKSIYIRHIPGTSGMSLVRSQSNNDYLLLIESNISLIYGTNDILLIEQREADRTNYYSLELNRIEVYAEHVIKLSKEGFDLKRYTLKESISLLYTE